MEDPKDDFDDFIRFIMGENIKKAKKGKKPVVYTKENRLLQIIPPIAIPILHKKADMYIVDLENMTSEVIKSLEDSATKLSSENHVGTPLVLKGADIEIVKLPNDEIYFTFNNRTLSVKAYESNKTEIFQINKEQTTSKIINSEDELFEALFKKETIAARIGVMQENRYVEMDKEMTAALEKEILK